MGTPISPELLNPPVWSPTQEVGSLGAATAARGGFLGFLAKLARGIAKYQPAISRAGARLATLGGDYGPMQMEMEAEDHARRLWADRLQAAMSAQRLSQEAKDRAWQEEARERQRAEWAAQPPETREEEFKRKIAETPPVTGLVQDPSSGKLTQIRFNPFTGPPGTPVPAIPATPYQPPPIQGQYMPEPIRRAIEASTAVPARTVPTELVPPEAVRRPTGRAGELEWVREKLGVDAMTAWNLVQRAALRRSQARQSSVDEKLELLSTNPEAFDQIFGNKAATREASRYATARRQAEREIFGNIALFAKLRTDPTGNALVEAIENRVDEILAGSEKQIEQAKTPGARSPSKADVGAPPASLLKTGVATHFSNGQIWTLENGVQKRLK